MLEAIWDVLGGDDGEAGYIGRQVGRQATGRLDSWYGVRWGGSVTVSGRNERFSNRSQRYLTAQREDPRMVCRSVESGSGRWR